MAEVVVAGFFICGLWGFIDICRRIKRRITGDAPRNEKRIRLSNEELANVMIARTKRDDREAEEWLKTHGYEPVGGEK
jgi:hypothetical protein